MKKFFAGILTIAILSATFQSTLIYAWFKINQTYIYETQCINKNKPISVCGGKCVLMQKLAEAQEKDPEKPMTPPVTKNTEILFIIQPVQIKKRDLLVFENSFQLFEDIIFDSGFISGIFHPPR